MPGRPHVRNIRILHVRSPRFPPCVYTPAVAQSSAFEGSLGPQPRYQKAQQEMVDLQHFNQQEREDRRSELMYSGWCSVSEATGQFLSRLQPLVLGVPTWAFLWVSGALLRPSRHNGQESLEPSLWGRRWRLVQFALRC